MELFGVRLLGFNAQNAHKLLLTLAAIAVIVISGRLLRALATVVFRTVHLKRVEFWTRQGIRLLTVILLILVLLSIWFDDPNRLATAAGLFTAGVAFALQRVITAIAAYMIILRGKTFNVGDRITMSGVRGDVIALDLIQTTIMEMGEPPGEQGDAPSMWVRARQYTGRIVTVTNDKIFDQPVYNYSRDFPYVWEEMQVPIAYRDNRKRAEEILLEVAGQLTVKISEMSEEDLKEMERRYTMRPAELKPRVFLRLTDNWVEMSVRFISHVSGIRELKDRMSRDILDRLEKAGIGIASGTYEIVAIPPVRIESVPDNGNHGHS